MYIKEINDIKIWENFIARYAPESLFQSWNWGEVEKTVLFKKEKQPYFKRMAFFEDDKLLGIAQINKVEARRGRFLHLRHGPVFAKWDKSIIKGFINQIKGIAIRNKCCFVRISPLLANSSENREIFKTSGFKDAPIHGMDGEYVWILDLIKNEDDLLKGMRKTTRNLIKQAEKLGVVIKKTTDEDEMSDFFSLYELTAKRHHFVKHTGIMEEFREFNKNKEIVLYKGYFQDKLISVALIIYYNNQAIYHHSASVEQKIPVNYLLQWEVIKDAKKKRLAQYNFWGISPEGKKNHPWRGLSLFKQGFGGRIKEYLHAQDLPLSLKYCTTYIVETVRKIRKGY